MRTAQTRVGIVGGGISGLAAALSLSRSGCHVEVFEREDEAGGLVSTFELDGVRLERYYHFLCGGDEGYFQLCRELGISDRIRWTRPRTGFHYEGTTYPFTSPVDLLRFAPIPFMQRVRFGMLALEARMRTEWRQLDEIPARPWLIDRIGQRAYDVIWHPLLALKFGERYSGISAAWVWHRLHRVARSKGRMGYLKGGTAFLLDTLIERIREQGGVVRTGAAVCEVTCEEGRVNGLRLGNGETYECGHVVSTAPLSGLASLLPAEWEAYKERLRRVDYVGVVCVVLKLKRQATPYFWLNVNDSAAPFNGIIEYTNLCPPDSASGHIVYVPYYVATNRALYQAQDEEVFRQSWDAVRRIVPTLSDSDLLAHRVFRDPFAQAVCPTGFLDVLCDTDSPIRGLHVLDSTFLYPEDRTQSGLILRARVCAEEIARDAKS